MDKIILPSMEFYGFHGVLPREKEVGQPFIIGVELFLDLKPAGISDDLAKTINYAEVFQEIKSIAEEESFHLIEALAQAIAQMLLKKYPVEKVKVTVDKPFAPLPGGHLPARVEIVRERKP